MAFTLWLPSERVAEQIKGAAPVERR